MNRAAGIFFFVAVVAMFVRALRNVEKSYRSWKKVERELEAFRREHGEL